MTNILISTLGQGIVWSIMAIGVYITFRLLDIADLSAEGAFPLGAATVAILITHDINPYLATLMAMIAGMLVGLIAGLIHTKLKIPPLLTGILVLTGLYSINIHIMQGQPNISLLNNPNIYTSAENILSGNRNFAVILVASITVLIVIFLLVSFLNTELGLAFRASGDNEKMSQANGINTQYMKILGYMLGNGLIALSGAMIAQKDGFSDIGMGIGTIVIGLASIIVAEVIIPNKSIAIRLMTIILGSFIYRLIIDLIINQPLIEISPTDLRIFSALLLLIILSIPEIKKGK